MTEQASHVWIPSPPGVRIKLEHGQCGGYGWEVAVEGPYAEIEQVLTRLADINARLEADYGRRAE